MKDTIEDSTPIINNSIQTNLLVNAFQNGSLNSSLIEEPRNVKEVTTKTNTLEKVCIPIMTRYWNLN